MAVPIDPRLTIRFSAELEDPPEGYDDPSGLIPASMLGNVLSALNDLVLATWDYAFSHGYDERFTNLRRLEASGAVNRDNVELIVTSFNKGSLELPLDWGTIVYLGSLTETILVNIGSNGLWDLIKYSFQGLNNLRFREGKQSEVDPIVNDLMPEYRKLVEASFRDSPKHVNISTGFTHKEPNGAVTSVFVNRGFQQAIREANQVSLDFSTTLVGTIVGIDYQQNQIRVQWEQFPDEPPIWCDVTGINFEELKPYVPYTFDPKPEPIGFIVEVGWHDGVAKIFPPDTYRIIRVIPKHELLNLDYVASPGLSRLPTHKMSEEISVFEEKFLIWFSWAEKNWGETTNIAGILGYLPRVSERILDRELTKSEINKVIRDMVAQGIIVQVKQKKKRPSHQTLKLNRKHPVISRIKEKLH